MVDRGSDTIMDKLHQHYFEYPPPPRPPPASTAWMNTRGTASIYQVPDVVSWRNQFELEANSTVMISHRKHFKKNKKDTISLNIS